jgi:hypothetical protein
MSIQPYPLMIDTRFDSSLVHEKSGPRMAYRIGMGVRHSDQNWKRELNRFISENQSAINRLLASYGVPLLDEQDKPIRAEP